MNYAEITDIALKFDMYERKLRNMKKQVIFTQEHNHASKGKVLTTMIIPASFDLRDNYCFTEFAGIPTLTSDITKWIKIYPQSTRVTVDNVNLQTFLDLPDWEEGRTPTAVSKLAE